MVARISINPGEQQMTESMKRNISGTPRPWLRYATTVSNSTVIAMLRTRRLPTEGAEAFARLAGGQRFMIEHERML
jgi:hypothetical protein